MASFNPDKLVAYYAYESKGPIPDLHTNGFDLNNVGTGVNIEAGGKLNLRARGAQSLINYQETSGDDPLWTPTNDGMTFVSWMQAPAGTLTVNQVGLAHYTNLDRGWIFWGRNATDTWAMSASNDGTSSTTVDWTSSYVGGTWYFVVGYLDPANNRIGIEVDRGTTQWAALTGPFHNSAEPVRAFFFTGSGGGVVSALAIDETSIWSEILNSEQLDFLYNGGGTPPGYAGISAQFGAGDGGASYNFYWGRE